MADRQRCIRWPLRGGGRLRIAEQQHEGLCRRGEYGDRRICPRGQKRALGQMRQSPYSRCGRRLVELLLVGSLLCTAAADLGPELLNAARKGQTQQVATLLSKGASV